MSKATWHKPAFYLFMLGSVVVILFDITDIGNSLNLSDCLTKSQTIDATAVDTALHKWYFDNALVASVMSSLKPSQEHELPNNRRDDVTRIATVWCGKHTFEFKHALSLLSAIKTMKPDMFYFYYNIFPRYDSYNQWLQYVIVSYPFLTFDHCEQCCKNGTVNNVWIEDEIRQRRSELYLNSNTIVTRNILVQDKWKFMDLQKALTGENCTTVTSITDTTVDKCFYMAKAKTFRPTNTWHCASNLCENIRFYMYRNPAPIENSRSKSPVIPYIVHYVYYKKNNIDFTFYMSILSALYVGNFSHIYIHSDQKLRGENWDNVMKLPQAKDKVHLVPKHNPCIAFGQKITQIQHCADTGKLDVAYKYGGLVIDPDFILIRKPDLDLFHYDAVLGYDFVPSLLNLGFYMSRPESTFAQIWRESLRKYNNSRWLWNSGDIPYKIAEYNPYLVKVSKHLQVVVPGNKYTPAWLNTLKAEHNITTLEEWQKVTIGLHYVHPPPFKNLTSVKTQKGMTGEVGRFILKKAGFLTD